MTILKTKILNSSIDINYEEKDKDKLLKLIENFNIRLKKYNNLKGMVKDSNIIILTALEIVDDLTEQKKIISDRISISNDLNVKELQIEKLSSEIIRLKDKIHLLESKLEEKNKMDFQIEDEINDISEQIKNLNKSMLLLYDE